MQQQQHPQQLCPVCGKRAAPTAAAVSAGASAAAGCCCCSTVSPARGSSHAGGGAVADPHTCVEAGGDVIGDGSGGSGAAEEGGGVERGLESDPSLAAPAPPELSFRMSSTTMVAAMLRRSASCVPQRGGGGGGEGAEEEDEEDFGGDGSGDPGFASLPAPRSKSSIAAAAGELLRPEWSITPGPGAMIAAAAGGSAMPAMVSDLPDPDPLTGGSAMPAALADSADGQVAASEPVTVPPCSAPPSRPISIGGGVAMWASAAAAVLADDERPAAPARLVAVAIPSFVEVAVPEEAPFKLSISPTWSISATPPPPLPPHPPTSRLQVSSFAAAAMVAATAAEGGAEDAAVPFVVPEHPPVSPLASTWSITPGPGAMIAAAAGGSTMLVAMPSTDHSDLPDSAPLDAHSYFHPPSEPSFSQPLLMPTGPPAAASPPEGAVEAASLPDRGAPAADEPSAPAPSPLTEEAGAPPAPTEVAAAPAPITWSLTPGPGAMIAAAAGGSTMVPLVVEEEGAATAAPEGEGEEEAVGGLQGSGPSAMLGGPNWSITPGPGAMIAAAATGAGTVAANALLDQLQEEEEGAEDGAPDPEADPTTGSAQGADACPSAASIPQGVDGGALPAAAAAPLLPPSVTATAASGAMLEVFSDPLRRSMELEKQAGRGGSGAATTPPDSRRVSITGGGGPSPPALPPPPAAAYPRAEPVEVAAARLMNLQAQQVGGREGVIGG